MRGNAIVVIVVAAGAAAGGFVAGRQSAGPAPSTAHGFAAGLEAGRNRAFCCYDGGWGYGEPYIVVLNRGGPGVTYRIARRWPMLGGLEYLVCERRVCSRSGDRPPQALP